MPDSDQTTASSPSSASTTPVKDDILEARQDNDVALAHLIAEAEQQANVPVIDHPKPCSHLLGLLNKDANPGEFLDNAKRCPTCLWSFCEDCASTLDPRYCRLCLSEPSANLIETPLKDTDGVTHEGRVLTPAPTAVFFQPRFGTLAKTISDMSQRELEDYIQQYKELVRQAERALDFRRVVLGASQLEHSQRADSERRKLQADKTKYPVRTVSIDKTTGKQVKKTASTVDLLGMLKALEALAALEKKVKP